MILRPFKTIRQYKRLVDLLNQRIELMKQFIDLREKQLVTLHTQESTIRVGVQNPQSEMVDLNRVERLVTEWVGSLSIENLVAILEGNDEGDYDYSREFVEELRSYTGAYLCYLWLQAAQKRAASQWDAYPVVLG